MCMTRYEQLVNRMMQPLSSFIIIIIIMSSSNNSMTYS